MELHTEKNSAIEKFWIWSYKQKATQWAQKLITQTFILTKLMQKIEVTQSFSYSFNKFREFNFLTS